ncbi:MAG TPA: N-acetyl-gamma-glutamyl-phosphate reductase [Lachnospiraceae bacterium]|nr:N-acetyl-gamma-glutamyl-phosphate reductase [Lachnospiraceae bacterium]
MKREKIKIFIDGSEGTTGLRINERFQERDDIKLLSINPELRKDLEERKRLINESDITFLCLPDAAAIEAVTLVENDKVRIIDSSTAHRTEKGWAYGFPELSPVFRENIREGKRVAVPGCHATGLISLLYPLIASGIMRADYPVSAFSLTGYSGGGKKMIAEYENKERTSDYDAPREYGLSQQHKHMKEMQAIAGLTKKPLFSPIVCDYYSGMVVSLPISNELLHKKHTPESLQAFFEQYYAREKFIKVNAFGAETESRGFLSANVRSGWDGLEIFVTGSEDRLVVSSRFDNLGKGASGAAIQCLNIMLGKEENYGLHL